MKCGAGCAITVQVMRHVISNKPVEKRLHGQVECMELRMMVRGSLLVGFWEGYCRRPWEGAVEGDSRIYPHWRKHTSYSCDAKGAGIVIWLEYILRSDVPLLLTIFL